MSNIINALFPIWGDNCIWCFFSGDLLRPAFHPPLFYADAFLRLPCHGVAQRRRNPGSRVRPGAIWRHSRNVSDWVVSGIICGEVFASSFLFFEEWWSKSFTAISHNWGIAVHCYRNSLYPNPLKFFQIISQCLITQKIKKYAVYFHGMKMNCVFCWKFL